MRPLALSNPDRQETSLDIHRPRPVYVPVIWAIVWLMRTAIYARAMTSYLLERYAPVTHIEPDIFHRNRQLRRARASCLRRAHRFQRKWRKPINPADYTPRAYAHFAYVAMMDKTISTGQFIEFYIRDNDLSRVQVYGLDAAHRISGYVHGKLQAALAGLMGLMHGLLDMTPLSLAAPTDPAPP